jgi:flagellar P-ring protein precursor FlgI
MTHTQPTRGLALLGLALLCAATASATRIKDLCEIQGAQTNSLKGVGLVVGLAGTGDKARAAIVAQERLLERLNVEIDSLSQLESDNVAVVMITADLPPFAKQGTRIDVLVNSLYDAKSLEGGTLLETLLFGIDNEVYAVAQGPISVGGFNVGSSGSSIRKNHVTAGRIPAGASVEREVPATITDGERINLLLRQPDFTTASRIVEAVNRVAGPGSASALGAGTVNIKIPPEEQADLVGFIARVQDLEVVPDYPAKVVINERTGTIVVGGQAIIKPCQVAHGSLSITIATTPQVSQPAPFSQGVTADITQSEIVAQEEGAYLMPVQGTSAREVADALNKLKVTPRDMIAIFQALREAGALDAALEIM